MDGQGETPRAQLRSSKTKLIVVGSGRLVLSLQKDTYETLGILGTPSKLAPKRQRHCKSASVSDSQRGT